MAITFLEMDYKDRVKHIIHVNITLQGNFTYTLMLQFNKIVDRAGKHIECLTNLAESKKEQMTKQYASYKIP